MLTDEVKIIDRWREHFEQLLETDREIQCINKSKDNVGHRNAEDNQITIEELENKVKGIKIGKAAGYDGIKSEQLNMFYFENKGKYQKMGKKQLSFQYLKRATAEYVRTEFHLHAIRLNSVNQF